MKPNKYIAFLAAALLALAVPACRSPYLPKASDSSSGGGSGGTPTPFTITNNMAASLVLGQDLLTTDNYGYTAKDMDSPVGIAISGGKIIVAEAGNAIVRIYNSIPTANNPAADVVIGDTGFGAYNAIWGSATAQGLDTPRGAVVSGGKLIVSDMAHNRVLVYNSIPTTNGAAADVVIGQPDMTTVSVTGTSAATLDRPYRLAVSGGKLLVADCDNARVLIYNSIPTTNGAGADLVLGQATMAGNQNNRDTTYSSVAANTLAAPTDVWTDGTKVVVADSGNNRVLIWNSFPTANGQAADVVVGQPNLTSGCVNQTSPYYTDSWTSATVPSAQSLSFAGDAFASVAVDPSGRLFISDCKNRRVLVYNSIPTANNAAADFVLGAPNFTTDQTYSSAAAANVIEMPSGITFDASGNAWITDRDGSRVLRFGSN